MGKRKPTPRLSSFLAQIQDLYGQIAIKAGEGTQWADNFYFGKNYNDAFQEFLEDGEYEILDLGLMPNGCFKKIIQYYQNPALQIVIHHDKDYIINTVLVDTVH